MIDNNLDIALIQEPWVNNHRVKGLKHTDYITYYKPSENQDETVRACILAKKKLGLFLHSNLSDCDTVVASLVGKRSSTTIISCYMGHDNPCPPEKLELVLTNNKSSGTAGDFLIGCDANARNTIWGSTETNDRGESLLNFINSNNLIINNRGNDPTFYFPPSVTNKNDGWREVLDVTLSSNSSGLHIENWRVFERA